MLKFLVYLLELLLNRILLKNIYLFGLSHILCKITLTQKLLMDQIGSEDQNAIDEFINLLTTEQET